MKGVLAKEESMATREAVQAAEVAYPSPGVWKLDPAHSSVEFTARHLMVTKVRGRFRIFDGTIAVDEDISRSKAEGVIDTSSIDTNQPDRDAHLKSPDFLDVEKWPEMKFHTTSLEKVDDRNWLAKGELTIRDVSRPIELNVQFGGVGTGPKGEVIFLSASTEINREDWGMTWNMALETGGVLVGKKVLIEIEAQALKA
jgi:polyisoprenoid-binding protein YceI